MTLLNSKAKPLGHNSCGAPSTGEMPTSIEKALAVLDLVAAEPDGVIGVADVAKALNIPKGTAHRILKTLEAHGFIGRSGIKYCLGPRMFGIGGRSSVIRFHDQLRDIAQPTMDDLVEDVRETVHLAVLQGHEVLYLEKITTPGGNRIPSRVGRQLPITCTGVGKAMLAFSGSDLFRELVQEGLPRASAYSVVAPGMLQRQLRETRQSGVAFDVQESRAGVACAAAPILGVDGTPLGAISIAGSTSRFNPKIAAVKVKDAARRISLDFALSA